MLCTSVFVTYSVNHAYIVAMPIGLSLILVNVFDVSTAVVAFGAVNVATAVVLLLLLLLVLLL